MAVVCSGVKSILDVPATLEYLETVGVPVVGFRTFRFPGYLTDSGSKLDWSVEDEGEAALVIQAMAHSGLGGSGLVVANPLPEEEQLDRDLHDRALISGLEGLEDRGVRGKDVTPFLLDRFATETRESLRVNRLIILNNAGLAAHRQGTIGTRRRAVLRGGELGVAPRVVVVGDLLYDLLAKVEGEVIFGTDTFVPIRVAAGGSGANGGLARLLRNRDPFRRQGRG